MSVLKSCRVGVVLLLAALPFSAVHADPWMGTASGAVVGGTIGGLVAGGPGAAVGVVLGGTMGVGADKEQAEQQRQARRSADYAQQADWERQRRRRNEELAVQRQESWAIADGGRSSGTVALTGDTVFNGNDVQLVVATQQALQRLGYEPGERGALDRQTVAVIKRYQQQSDLLVTGRPSRELLQHIRSGKQL